MHSCDMPPSKVFELFLKGCQKHLFRVKKPKSLWREVYENTQKFKNFWEGCHDVLVLSRQF